MRKILLLLSLLPTGALGYANFIGHGYTSCLNCHFNPFGGGQLNDYGRVVSATAISSGALYPESVKEEQVAYMSGFLFRKPKQNFLRTQVNYRGFQLYRNPNGANEKKTWLTMQADVRATLKFGEGDKFIVSGDYGKTPTPLNGLSGKEYENYRSRSHYIGYRFKPTFGVYAGLMDKVFGLRVIEHTAYSRIATQTTMNDQTHGVAGHFLGKEWEGGAHIFAGNLAQDADIRMKGISTMVEKTIFDLHRVGFSLQSSRNTYFNLNAASVHGKFNLKEGSALLSEIGQTVRKTDNGSEDRTSRYGLLQTYIRPWRGFYVFSNIEYLKNDISIDNYTVRVGPGIQYFPIQRIELRADLYNIRNFTPDTSTIDSWMFLYQMHVWL